MTDKTELHDDDLSAYFDAARALGPTPSPGLLARVEADADATLRVSLSDSAAARRPVGLFATLGGWPAIAGLATATVAGFWFGYADPQITSLTAGLAASDYDVGAFLPGYLPAGDGGF